jgi:nucleoside 2-deoxyribosyltransferase
VGGFIKVIIQDINLFILTEQIIRMKDVKIYVASPFGFSEAGRDFMYSKILPIVLDLGYEVLDPWKLTPEEIILRAMNAPYGVKRRAAWQKVNPIIGSNNEKAIKISNGLLAVLDGTDVDSGTASEIGCASALGKPILGYRGDFRLASDNDGSLVNLQVEYFIRKNGGDIVKKFEDIKPALKRIFG